MTNHILVIGGNGKTGRRIAENLEALDVPVRTAGRSTYPPFDWNNSSTWPQVVDKVSAVYISYQPDLAVPGAKDAVAALVDLVLSKGVRRIVLLSGRGEEEAQATEKALQISGADWTILRCAWFNQNFSEGQFLELIQSGEVALPVSAVREPFVDADDIAEAAVKALTEDGHVGHIYELTGPRLLSFGEAVAEIAAASGRDIRFRTVGHAEFMVGLTAAGLPDDIVWLLDELFARVLDGRNEYVTDDAKRVLGRSPRDFSRFAEEVAASGTWR